MSDTLTLEGKCPRISIDRLYVKKVNVLTLASDAFSIKDCYINELSFGTGKSISSRITLLEIFNNNIQGKTSVAKVEFSSLILRNNLCECFEIEANSWKTIDLNSTYFETLILRQLKTNSNRLLLEQLEFDNLEIHNCILDNTLINLVNLDHDGKIKIKKSSLSQAVIHSITWPRTYRVFEEPEINLDIKGGLQSQLLDHYADLREVYRQLKVLSLKADNKIDGKLFMISELRIYYMLISLTVLSKLHTFKIIHRIPLNLVIMILFPFYFIQIPLLWPFRKLVGVKEYRDNIIFKWENFGNWLILHTNSVFSGFGESLSKPIFWLIAFHSLLFLALIKQFPEIGIKADFANLQNHDWKVFWEGFDIWINLISPVHSSKIPNLDKSTEVPIFSTTDFAIRACSGYFIFYFLKATRKFNF